MSFASMAMTSIFTPKTPTRSKDLSFLPLNSSPLASSPGSSPVSAAQARRRSQYKSHTTNTPSASHSRQSSRRNAGRNDASSSRTPTSTPNTVSADENRRAVLRERFRSQCLERAQKDRQRKIDGKRRMSSEFSSDGPDEMMDFEGSEDEDAILNDELFGRIMSSVKRKQQHQYRLSYAQEVGSSFDPDFDDVTEWENELRGLEEAQPPAPEDLEEEELAAYIEEYELGLDNLPLDEIFSLSDLDDIEEEGPLQSNSRSDKSRGGEDVDMDS